MNTFEILSEELKYKNTLELTKQIASYANKKFMGKDQSNGISIDITHLIPSEYNPKNKKLEFTYKMKYSKVAKNVDNTTYWLSNPVKIEIVFSRSYNYVYKDLQLSAQLIDKLHHELIHALDALNGLVSKRPYMLLPHNTAYNYLDDDYEFKQIFYQLEKYKKNYPHSWEKITTYKKLMDIIIKHKGVIGTNEEDLYTSPVFRRRLLNALSKEKMLPPNFKH